MPLVPDAAAVMAAVLPQRHSDAARDVLLRIADAGAVVPAIWHLEVGNILLAAERRGILDAPRRAAVLDHLARLPVATDTDTAARAWGETLALARTYALSLHDAAYLELALRRDLTLATFDAALLRAAGAAGARTV